MFFIGVQRANGGMIPSQGEFLQQEGEVGGSRCRYIFKFSVLNLCVFLTDQFWFSRWNFSAKS